MTEETHNDDRTRQRALELAIGARRIEDKDPDIIERAGAFHAFLTGNSPVGEAP